MIDLIMIDLNMLNILKTLRLTDDKISKLSEWMSKFKPSTAAIGGEFTYCFTPTGLGTIVKVKHYQGEELDLTDYESW